MEPISFKSATPSTEMRLRQRFVLTDCGERYAQPCAALHTEEKCGANRTERQGACRLSELSHKGC